MTRNDRAALKLALEQARAEDPGRAQQIHSMLEERAWTEVANFAASVCQNRTLKLQPWDLPPCDVDEDDDSDINANAVRLLRKMLAAGVSRYHPDPLATIEAAAERKRA